MDYQQLHDLHRGHPAWKLLTADHAAPAHIEDLILIASASEAAEWENQVYFLPLTRLVE